MTVLKKSMWLALFLFSIILNAQKPNVVVVLVDDSGYKDWGFQGSEISLTPQVDQLANEGIVFTQGYVTNSVCAPSRAAILSGQYQNRIGFEYNLVNNETTPTHGKRDMGLKSGVKTIGDYLKQLGYTTGYFGKWHLGETKEHHPNARGFDHFYGILKGSRPYNKRTNLNSKKLRLNNTIVEPKDNNFYVTDLFTDNALEFIDDQLENNNSFLAFISYTAPHGPFVAKEEDKALFQNLGLSDVEMNYYGMIHCVDQNVERIVNLLKSKGEYENTLFIFLSDNGGVSKVGSNGNLRDYKGSCYEGGIRVPFFMSWKNKITSGLTYDQQIISLDVLPTLIEAAGGNLSSGVYKELDGVSLFNAVQKPNEKIHDELYWRKLDYYAIVSDGKNKLIQKYDDSGSLIPSEIEQYNLENDISETQNIYTDTKNVNALLQKYNKWNEEMVLPHWISTETLDKLCPNATSTDFCQKIKVRYVDNPIQSYEAENASFNENVGVAKCNNASNDKFVKNITNNNTLKFETIWVDERGVYDLDFKYFSTKKDRINFKVNQGKYVQSNKLKVSKSTCKKDGNPQTYSKNVTLNKGYNTITVKNSVNIDRILVKPNNANSSSRVIQSEALSTNNVYKNDEETNVTLYPNPVKQNGVLYLQIPSALTSKRGVVAVYDVKGNLVNQQQIFFKEKNEVSVNRLKAGIYHMVVKIEENTYTKKFIVQN